MRLTRKQAILIKQETTQGTAATPSASTDGLLVEALEFTVDAEQLTRDYFRASLDSIASVTGKRSASVKFTTELKGSGTRGTASIAGYTAMDAAIQACGFTSTVVASTSITYAPTSAPASASFFGPGKSVTIEVYKDGVKHQIVGAVGNMKISAESGQYPKVEFDFKGMYVAASDASVPTLTLAGTLPLPVAWESSTITVHGSTAAIIDKIEIDAANTLTQRDDPRVANAVKGFVITGRAPKGSVEIEAETGSVFDAWSKLIGNTEASTSVSFGATNGNIVTLTMAKSQVVSNSYGDRGGIMTYTTGLQYNQNTGDDWLSFVVT